MLVNSGGGGGGYSWSNMVKSVSPGKKKSGGGKKKNPVTSFYNSYLNPPKKKSGGGKIATAPKTRSNYSSSSGSRSYSSGGSSRSSGGSSGGSSRSGGGGGGGYDPAAAARAAERRAIARENRQKARAANRFKQQSQHLEGQATALKRALNVEYKKGLNVRLGNVSRVLAQQQAVINTGYNDRLKNLMGNVGDNQMAEANQSVINTANMVRERNSAVSEALTHGAGESDLLNAQMMSLRNWNANQSEVLRSYYDSLRSVNTSLVDLNADTKTAMVNNDVQANADKEQLWTNYYNQRSETLTQLGNVRGQQADYLSQANEMKKGSGNAKGKAGAAKNAFMASAKESGKAWKNPGLSAATKAWKGEAPLEMERTNASRLEGARTARMNKRPEGATLRKW